MEVQGERKYSSYLFTTSAGPYYPLDTIETAPRAYESIEGSKIKRMTK
jgi:hypothetical protein